MLTAATVGVSGQTLLYYFGDDLGMRLLWTSPHQFVSSLIPTNKIPACRAKKKHCGSTRPAPHFPQSIASFTVKTLGSLQPYF